MNRHCFILNYVLKMNYFSGCPLGLDPMEITRRLAAKSVTIYTVGCDVCNITQDFLMAISHMTGGQFVPLNNANLLAKVCKKCYIM